MDRRGYWAAKTVGRAEARQNGKGDEIEAIELWGVVTRGEAIVHTAHEIPTSKAAHQRLAARFEAHRDLRRLVSKVRYANGDQAIELTNEGLIVYRTRTAGGGRGLDDISRLVIDEAQHAQPEQLASSTPILAANPNPQTIMAGTAAIKSKSAWWWQQRLRALEGDNHGFAWHEHTAEVVSLNEEDEIESLSPDPEDRDNWYLANPALEAGRISEGFLAEQLKTLGPDLFAREHLCVWDPLPSISAESKIDDAAWRSAVDVSSEITGPVVATVDTGFDQSQSALSVCGRNRDGIRQVEVIEALDGTAWIETRLAAALDRNADITTLAVDASGPAKALVPMLERVAVERGMKLVKMTGGAYAAGCASFVAAIPDHLVHRGDARLTNQALNTGARKYGSEDAWMWDRRGGDITALVSSTVAFAVADGLPTTVRRSAYEDHGLEVV